jgi:hypothetical protein
MTESHYQDSLVASEAESSTTLRRCLSYRQRQKSKHAYSRQSFNKWYHFAQYAEVSRAQMTGRRSPVRDLRKSAVAKGALGCYRIVPSVCANAGLR